MSLDDSESPAGLGHTTYTQVHTQTFDNQSDWTQLAIRITTAQLLSFD